MSPSFCISTNNTQDSDLSASLLTLNFVAVTFIAEIADDLMDVMRPHSALVYLKYLFVLGHLINPFLRSFCISSPVICTSVSFLKTHPLVLEVYVFVSVTMLSEQIIGSLEG